MCVYLWAHVQRSEDTFWELILLYHVGPRDWNWNWIHQTWLQVPLTPEPAWLFFFLKKNNNSNSNNISLAQDGLKLKLTIFLPPPKWNYRHVPLCVALAAS